MAEDEKKVVEVVKVKAEASTPEKQNNKEKTDRQGGGARSKRGGGGGGRKQADNRSSTLDPDLEERVVSINRVAKVVKGGRRFSFSALIIVGDRKGRIGYGLGKAKEVPEAIRKASQVAQKSMVKVSLDGGTIPHRVLGEFDAGKIIFRPAASGTGVKAAGACRAILELAGVRNILTKSLRGNNPHNVVKATFVALKELRSVAEIAAIRGKEAKGLRIKP